MLSFYCLLLYYLQSVFNVFTQSVSNGLGILNPNVLIAMELFKSFCWWTFAKIQFGSMHWWEFEASQWWSFGTDWAVAYDGGAMGLIMNMTNLTRGVIRQNSFQAATLCWTCDGEDNLLFQYFLATRCEVSVVECNVYLI